MDTNLLSFYKVKPNESLIDQIWTLDANTLDSLDDSLISKYVLVLGQWLIYYESEVNKVKSKISELNGTLDTLAAYWLTPEIIKTYKTQGAAKEYVIGSNAESAAIKEKLLKLKDELILVEGMDRAVVELIAAFKRELTRRDNELYFTRKERQGL